MDLNWLFNLGPQMLTALEFICVTVILGPVAWGLLKKVVNVPSISLPSFTKGKRDCRHDVNSALITISDAIPPGDNEFKKALLVLAPLGVVSVEK